MDDTHRPAKQGRGVHPPWSWKPQRPMEVGYPKVFIRLKVYIYISLSLYIYIHTYTNGRGDDTVGNPHRAQISRFELFELILLSKLDRQFPVEPFEAGVSQSSVPFPPLHPAASDGFPRPGVWWARTPNSAQAAETFVIRTSF